MVSLYCRELLHVYAAAEGRSRIKGVWRVGRPLTDVMQHSDVQQIVAQFCSCDLTLKRNPSE